MANVHKQFAETLVANIDTMLQPYAGRFDYIKEYCIVGGKMTRPLMFLEALESFGVMITDEHIDVAVALELLHLFLLMHDDIMDNDDMRRDKPTVHAYYAALHGDVAGRAYGLVFGDLVYTKAISLLSQASVRLGKNLLDEVLCVVKKTIEGQVNEMQLEDLPKEEDVLKFYEQKTAQYSIYLPLALAGVVAGKDKQYFTDLRDCSARLGVAYQCYDDVIEVVGMKVRRNDGRIADVMRLKATPILIRSLELLPKQKQQALFELRAKGETISVEDEQLILHVMTTKGILIEEVSRIEKAATQAKDCLEHLGIGDGQVVQKLLATYTQVQL